ncbi:MAG: hypothetical protein K0M49_02540, partial [Arenimonas sp.]|nr:hypothetical protein [Arenimonas sp.]
EALYLFCIFGAGLRGGGNGVSDLDLAYMAGVGGIAGAGAMFGYLLAATFAPEPQRGVAAPDP